MRFDNHIDKSHWENYFNYISKEIIKQQVTVEVAGLDIGDQFEEEWATLDGVSYDPKEDTLNVHTVPLGHMIKSPQKVVSIEEGPFVRAILVMDTAQRAQILTFRYLLELPEARSRH